MSDYWQMRSCVPLLIILGSISFQNGLNVSRRIQYKPSIGP